MLTSVGGTVSSYYLDAAPGATIVVGGIVIFALTWPIGTLLSRRRRTRPAGVSERVGAVVLTDGGLTADHPHRHGGPDCEHPPIPHGDHLDYLHDGHRHAQHDDHADEHRDDRRDTRTPEPAEDAPHHS